MHCCPASTPPQSPFAQAPIMAGSLYAPLLHAQQVLAAHLRLACLVPCLDEHGGCLGRGDRHPVILFRLDGLREPLPAHAQHRSGWVQCTSVHHCRRLGAWMGRLMNGCPAAARMVRSSTLMGGQPSVRMCRLPSVSPPRCGSPSMRAWSIPAPGPPVWPLGVLNQWQLHALQLPLAQSLEHLVVLSLLPGQHHPWPGAGERNKARATGLPPCNRPSEITHQSHRRPARAHDHWSLDVSHLAASRRSPSIAPWWSLSVSAASLLSGLDTQLSGTWTPDVPMKEAGQ